MLRRAAALIIGDTDEERRQFVNVMKQILGTFPELSQPPHEER
jgi:hypothetical protein